MASRLVLIQRNRPERAEKLVVAEARVSAGQSQRQIAAELGVARSTLQDWHRVGSTPAVPAALAAFIATPEGVRWLQHMVLAAQFAITLRGAAGVRVVCEFLELSELAAFVGASYGSQQALNPALEAAVVAVAEEQRAGLAEGMAPRAQFAAALRSQAEVIVEVIRDEEGPTRKLNAQQALTDLNDALHDAFTSTQTTAG